MANSEGLGELLGQFDWLTRTTREHDSFSIREPPRCDYCGGVGGHVNLRGAFECAGCGAVRAEPVSRPQSPGWPPYDAVPISAGTDWIRANEERTVLVAISGQSPVEVVEVDWSLPGSVLHLPRDAVTRAFPYIEWVVRNARR